VGNDKMLHTGVVGLKISLFINLDLFSCSAAMLARNLFQTTEEFSAPALILLTEEDEPWDIVNLASVKVIKVTSQAACGNQAAGAESLNIPYKI
jgi:hypothetical protein